MQTTTAFNVFEVLIWSAIGCEILRRGLKRRGGLDYRYFLAALAFFAFAGSDAVELRTGVWWRPWWLLAWKAACVVLFALLYLQNLVLRYRQRV